LFENAVEVRVHVYARHLGLGCVLISVATHDVFSSGGRCGVGDLEVRRNTMVI
jgi:hypothetical protein